MASSPLNTILVTGATGKQGGAVISSLLSSNSPPKFNIIALSRNINSPTSKSLAAKPNVTVVQGDLNDCPSLFAKLPKLYGVFSVQVSVKPKSEEPQGKALVDAAASHGVKHFIYSSVDRGGPEKSDVDPTSVTHFAVKYRIEKHLQASGLEWTIIRPTGFMDNYTPDIAGKGMSAMWKLDGEQNKMQMVACKDIGRLAGVAFNKPEEFKGRAVSLAGDDLTWAETNAVFKKVLGMDMPTTYGWVGSALRSVFYDLMGRMFEWLKTDGFGADVEECRRILPGMLTFEDWLRQESKYKHLAK